MRWRCVKKKEYDSFIHIIHSIISLVVADTQKLYTVLLAVVRSRKNEVGEQVVLGDELNPPPQKNRKNLKNILLVQ
jgi:hypothetical protein